MDIHSKTNGDFSPKSLDENYHTCCLKKKSFSGYPCYYNLISNEDLYADGVWLWLGAQTPLLKARIKCHCLDGFYRSKGTPIYGQAMV